MRRCIGSSGITSAQTSPSRNRANPGVTRFERSELLEQILSRPVARVAEHVLIDLPAQARQVARQEAERVIV
jgi:hypothetical protein